MNIPICQKDIDLNVPCIALIAYFILDTFNDTFLESRGEIKTVMLSFKEWQFFPGMSD